MAFEDEKEAMSLSTGFCSRWRRRLDEDWSIVVSFGSGEGVSKEAGWSDLFGATLLNAIINRRTRASRRVLVCYF